MNELSWETVIAALPVIASGAAVLVSLYTARVTRRGNKETIQSNDALTHMIQAAEDRRAKDQLDADIVWHTRLEWIKDVRELTEDFLSCCYQYIEGKAENLDRLAEIDRKKMLLILYIGLVKQPLQTSGEDLLLNVTTNQGKGEHLVQLIQEIYTLTAKYHENLRNNHESQNTLGKCQVCRDSRKYGLSDIPYKRECITDEYDTPFSDKQCEDLIAKHRRIEKDSLANIQRLLADLDRLTTAMRIYLKLELDSTRTRDTSSLVK